MDHSHLLLLVLLLEESTSLLFLTIQTGGAHLWQDSRIAWKSFVYLRRTSDDVTNNQQQLLTLTLQLLINVLL